MDLRSTDNPGYQVPWNVEHFGYPGPDKGGADAPPFGTHPKGRQDVFRGWKEKCQSGTASRPTSACYRRWGSPQRRGRSLRECAWTFGPLIIPDIRNLGMWNTSVIRGLIREELTPLPSEPTPKGDRPGPGDGNHSLSIGTVRPPTSACYRHWGVPERRERQPPGTSTRST
jgi:hypothetical protein